METIERETYYITAEQMKNVNTYIPLRAKMEWIDQVAERCMNKVEMTATYMDENIQMPPMYKENIEFKNRYLMGAFVKLYLRGSWETAENEDEWLMPIDEYDKWAGGHIFGQVEKFKSDYNLKDICFDMLNDFKDLTRMLNAEVSGLLRIMNDPAARQMASMQLSLTPESMERALEELQSAKDALMEYEEKRGQAEAELRSEHHSEEE